MASAAPAPKPAAADDAPAIDINILFGNGSAELQPAAIKSLDVLGQALASPDLASSRFRIEGHTDAVGSKDDNRALSARRAAAVVEFLTHKYHIDAKRLESVGKGEDDLLIPTPDEVAEPRNRRVRVINITG
jgi:outer membrane protein OmpA-like peptidoglycan-associated protein